MTNTTPTTPTTRNSNITIIGSGKVGTSLAQLFRANNHTVSLLGKDYLDHTDVLSASNLVIICVNDGTIEQVCQNIAGDLAPQTVVTHCSGALESTILISARNAGCFIASTHPLNTFPTLKAALNTFADNNHQSYLMTEGDAQALAILMPLFEQLGFNTLSIKTQSKAAYHAATVFACNYLTTLMDLSLQSAELAGLGRTLYWQAIQPIVSATLKNIDQHGTVNALSGPIARADSSTLKKHVLALKNAEPELQQAYCELASHTIKLASKRNELDDAQLQTMQEIIND